MCCCVNQTSCGGERVPKLNLSRSHESCNHHRKIPMSASKLHLCMGFLTSLRPFMTKRTTVDPEKKKRPALVSPPLPERETGKMKNHSRPVVSHILTSPASQLCCSYRQFCRCVPPSPGLDFMGGKFIYSVPNYLNFHTEKILKTLKMPRVSWIYHFSRVVL